MGCDIHGFWEVKDHTGNWMAIDAINPQRNYIWFGIIAAVRGGPDIGTAHRGVPKDASGAYQDMIDEWGIDLHSHTWLTYSEVIKATEELNRRLVEAYNEPLECGWEIVPNKKTSLNQLVIAKNITWKWSGTVEDLMYPGGDLEECIRMVVCFDS